MAYQLSTSPAPIAIRPTTRPGGRGTVIRARAPLRISFAGGATDMPSYYLEHGGAVLVSTINRYAFVTLCPTDEPEIRIQSLDFDLTVKYGIDEEPIFDGVMDLAKAAVRRLNPQNSQAGLDLYLQSDAPAGSGLGGSASLTAAVLGALADFANVRLDRYELAEAAFLIERTDLQISGGRQDQYAAIFGGFNLIEFSRDGVTVNPLRIPPDTLSDLEYHLVLCYTGKTRLSAGLIDKQDELLRQGRSDTVDGLGALRRLAYDMKDALLKARLGGFAEMLDQAWASKLKVNPEISDSGIDEMYTEARRHGALGGKLLGAGGGGYLLLFCEGGKKRAVRERLEALGGQFADFSFTQEGLQTWESRCL
ncbi:MAG TPA: GHMP kinase [Dehalococcoidia bacterium]|nr:GHMP kinase [Dehalococcoidia bacterium]